MHGAIDVDQIIFFENTYITDAACFRLGIRIMRDVQLLWILSIVFFIKSTAHETVCTFNIDILGKKAMLK